MWLICPILDYHAILLYYRLFYDAIILCASPTQGSSCKVFKIGSSQCGFNRIKGDITNVIMISTLKQISQTAKLVSPYKALRK